MILKLRSIQLNKLYPDSFSQMDCDQSELITLLGYDCLFNTLIFNSTYETSVVKYVNLKLCINTDLWSGNPGISNRREGGGGGREYLRK